MLSTRHRGVACVLLAMVASGCATGLAPRALRSERPDYNQQILRSTSEEMLLNLVRLRYNDSPLFLELASVVVQYGYDASLNASGTFGGGSSGTVGTGLMYAEHPTITYKPLTGEAFATRMLSPVALDSLMLFEQTGWRADRLFLVLVQRVNDLVNAREAAGPTPRHPPDYEAFADFVEHFQRARAAGLIGLNWEMEAHETNVPGRNPRFWIHAPADAHSPFAADVAAVRRDLGLAPGRGDFELTSFPFERQPNQVGIRCRSLLGVMYFLSQSVEPPPPHVAEHLVTVTENDDGQPFDWSLVTGRVMAIHSQQDRPQHAAVAVPYRGWWFYIADDDQDSKVTFDLVTILFSLQSATGKGESPVLTLPVR
jgi:hypothetical protein